MKKEIKYFVAGCLFTAVIGVTSVFGAGYIKSAQYNANQVIFDGRTLNLADQPMVSIVEEGQANAVNYMPVRAVLEQMGYTVTWDGAAGTVNINSPTLRDEMNNTISELEYATDLQEKLVIFMEALEGLDSENTTSADVYKAIESMQPLKTVTAPTERLRPLNDAFINVVTQMETTFTYAAQYMDSPDDLSLMTKMYESLESLTAAYELFMGEVDKMN